MFRVRNQDTKSEFFFKEYVVYATRSNTLVGTPRTEFLIYDGEWRWVDANDYSPVREEKNYE